MSFSGAMIQNAIYIAQQPPEWQEIRPLYQTHDQAEHYTLDVPQGTRHLINPGAVGQPRDADWRAAFALYNTATEQVTFHRVPYNIAAAQAAIREAGLPERLASRLSSGR